MFYGINTSHRLQSELKALQAEASVAEAAAESILAVAETEYETLKCSLEESERAVAVCEATVLDLRPKAAACQVCQRKVHIQASVYHRFR